MFSFQWTPPIVVPHNTGYKKGECTMLQKAKVLLIALAVIVIAGSAYAFAAANTVPASTAGSGTSTVSGYTVTGLVYDLNDTDPSLVDNIIFSISPDTGSDKAVAVFIQYENSGTWKTCGLVDGTLPAVDVTCDYTSDSLALTDVTAVNVVANGTIDPNP